MMVRKDFGVCLLGLILLLSTYFGLSNMSSLAALWPSYHYVADSNPDKGLSDTIYERLRTENQALGSVLLSGDRQHVRISI
jgi:hypothetical protein